MSREDQLSGSAGAPSVDRQGQAAVLQRQLARERDRLRVLLDATNALVLRHDVGELVEAISRCVRQIVPHEFSTLGLPEGEGTLRQYTVDFDQGTEHRHEEVLFDVASTVSQEIGMALMRAFSHAVTGQNPLEVPGRQTIQLKMNQWDFELSWAFRIRK